MTSVIICIKKRMDKRQEVKGREVTNAEKQGSVIVSKGSSFAVFIKLIFSFHLTMMFLILLERKP